MEGANAVDHTGTNPVGAFQTEGNLTWYRQDDLLSLAKEYAALRNLEMQPWGRVVSPTGAFVSMGGWRGLLATLFRWRIIDSVSWRSMDAYGRWRTEVRYFLDLSGIS